MNAGSQNHLAGQGKAAERSNISAKFDLQDAADQLIVFFDVTCRRMPFSTAFFHLADRTKNGELLLLGFPASSKMDLSWFWLTGIGKLGQGAKMQASLSFRICLLS